MSLGWGRDGAAYSATGDDNGLGVVFAERMVDPEPSQSGGASKLEAVLGINVGRIIGLIAEDSYSDAGGESDITGDGGG
jgi:hypothetical protein